MFRCFGSYMMGIDEFNVSTEAHTITFESLPKRKPVLHSVKNSDTPGSVSSAMSSSRGRPNQ